MYIVTMRDFEGEMCGMCAVALISDAMSVASSAGYAVDVVDGTTGEVLWTRIGSEIIYTIFG